MSAADNDNWQAAADLTEQALDVMPYRFATSARASALRLAATAEAALTEVGAVHALRYADCWSRSIGSRGPRC